MKLNVILQLFHYTSQLKCCVQSDLTGHLFISRVRESHVCFCSRHHTLCLPEYVQRAPLVWSPSDPNTRLPAIFRVSFTKFQLCSGHACSARVVTYRIYLWEVTHVIGLQPADFTHASTLTYPQCYVRVTNSRVLTQRYGSTWWYLKLSIKNLCGEVLKETRRGKVLMGGGGGA